ncbi:MAG: alcohol dehydrogenase catalytic domain-containing protein [Candidatus Lokiarchaeota archaeon]|nr:alcohol dehydrogenase catalytic domain-containing protein [Candidatus Lokiarchaeota archaeon]
MRAAVFLEKEKIEIRDDYPKPVPGPNEVLIKVHLCGICGTDVKNYYHQLYQTPLVMGHEFSGQIVETGSEIKKFKIGENATGINVMGKDYNDMRRIGIFKDGAFAEYVIVPEDYLFSFHDYVSSEEIAMIESYAVAMRGIRWADIDPTKPTVIIGAGTIGLAMLDLLRARFPNLPICIIELQSFLQDKALEFGANFAVSPQKGKIRKFFNQYGEVPIIFDCAGTQDTLKLSTEIVGQSGNIVMVGIPRGEVILSGLILSLKEVGLRGCISHNREDIMQTIKLMLDKKLHPERLITDYVSLEQLQENLQRYKSTGPREFIKIMVKLH